MIQPKPFLDKFKLRNKAKGVERRRNMSKIILEHAPNFPLSVEYKDIDEAFQKWVENDLDVEYDGKKIPTFKFAQNSCMSWFLPCLYFCQTFLTFLNICENKLKLLPLSRSFQYNCVNYKQSILSP